MRTPRRITLLTQVDNYTGYGQYGIRLFRELQRQGFHVSIRAINIAERADAKIPRDIHESIVHRIQPEGIEILLAPPFQMPTPGQRTIYSTMWESTRLQQESVRLLNLATCVVVPCEWNKKNFAESGVKRPIFVCPLGVDPTIFFDTPFPKIKPFVFGTGGRLSHGPSRKGVNDVIAAFVDEFKPHEDVRLRVKVFQDCPVFRTKDNRVDYMTDCVDEPAVARWFSSLHCFVSAAKSEGWGLMQHQAMACGRPLISTVYSGVAEFFDETCGIPISYREGSALDFWDGLGNWAYPDYRELKAAMRKMFTTPEIIQGFATAARERALSFDWQRCGNRMIEIIEKTLLCAPPVP